LRTPAARHIVAAPRDDRWHTRSTPLLGGSGIIVGLLAVVGAYAFIPTHLLSTEYSPQEDDSQFSVSLDLPPGTTLEQTDAATKLMEAGLKRIPEVKSRFTSVGAGGGGLLRRGRPLGGGLATGGGGVWGHFG